jgi:hypothetical protein
MFIIIFILIAAVIAALLIYASTRPDDLTVSRNDFADGLRKLKVFVEKT